MSRPDSINLFVYETATPDDIKTMVMDYFMRSGGVSSAWFKFNFVYSPDGHETDYLEDYFTFTSSNELTNKKCQGIIEVYRNWLAKVSDTPEPDVIDRPLKDSGERRDFSTGSRRDVATGKGRYDLLPFEVIDALAKHYEKGYQKYDPDHVWNEVDNWQKGQPLSVFLDSGLRHAFKWKSGMKDEDHLIAAIWNLMAAWWTQDAIRKGELPIELGDTGELWRENRDLTKGKK